MFEKLEDQSYTHARLRPAANRLARPRRRAGLGDYRSVGAWSEWRGDDGVLGGRARTQYRGPMRRARAKKRLQMFFLCSNTQPLRGRFRMSPFPPFRVFRLSAGAVQCGERGFRIGAVEALARDGQAGACGTTMRSRKTFRGPTASPSTPGRCARVWRSSRRRWKAGTSPGRRSRRCCCACRTRPPADRLPTGTGRRLPATSSPAGF